MYGINLRIILRICLFGTIVLNKQYLRAYPIIAARSAALEKAGVKHIRCMFRDHTGLVWIGTDNGLYRYDGTNVDHFFHQPHDPASIPQNEINAIAEDRLRRIWIGTNLGVAVRQPNTAAWKCYNKKQHSLDEDFDNKVYCDSEGGIWVGNSKGLFLFNNKHDNFTRACGVLRPQKSLPGYVTTLADWKGDTLAVGTLTGLVLVNKSNFGFRSVTLPQKTLTVNKIWVDASRRIWLGTWGGGCLVSDSVCRKFTILRWEKPAGDTLANIVTGLLPMHYSGRTDLWVSTTAGIYRVENCCTTGQPIIHTVSVGSDAPVMLADDDEYIWTGGRYVNRFFAGDHFFKPYHNVKGMVEDLKQLGNTLAISTWYAPSGITVLNENSGTPLYQQPRQHNIDDAAVAGIARDRYGRIWAGTLNGIKIFNKNWQTSPVLPGITIDNNQLLRRGVSAIEIIHDTVWVSEYEQGIELFDLNFHKLKTFLPNDGSGLRDNLVTRFFCDPKGRTWLCGNSRLYRYNSATSKFSGYNLSEEKGLFSVNDLAALPDERLVVASSAGLYIFNMQNEHATRLNAPLINDENIQSVALDHEQNIWYITRERLIRYQPKLRHFTAFGEEDGLNSDDELEWLRSFDGKRFYLAGKSGLFTFNAQSATRLQPVKVYLHALLANDSVISIPPDGKAVKLSYLQRRLSFEFGAINFIKPEQNEYAWRLDGVDESWIYSLHNTASYDNLAPGVYQFRLKAKNAAGVWSVPISETIMIIPPFWATWWFKMLCIISIAGVLFAGIRYILQRNLRERILSLEKEQAVEIERNRIAGDMHDDLGSGLTKIAILSELTRAQITDSAVAAAQLETISAVSREMVDSLQNIVWLLDPRNDSLESLALYIRRYVDGFFESTGMLPVYDFAEETGSLRLSEKLRRNIFLVVKEACNNVVKHARATSVHIGLCVKNNRLVVTVADNGRGFDTSASKQLSNGLRNMQMRMEQIDGSMDIDTMPGLGTKLIFKIALG